jgi:hypothetical protein
MGTRHRLVGVTDPDPGVVELLGDEHGVGSVG